MWWRDAVIYQVYVRSFADGNGDGVGDLDGIRGRLDYLSWLGVDAIWLTPFYTSPMADHGYDVANPRDVDPLFGDLAAFDALVQAAHDTDIKVIVDVVPNHTSDQHPWFQEAIAGGPARSRYHFRDKPNNWPSDFGGPAWHQVPDGWWYLHLFAPEQPDLNWDNPEVWADLEETLRFWLGRGVDGFRIDVANAMIKGAGLPDLPESALNHDPEDWDDASEQLSDDPNDRDPRWDNDAVHDVHRMVRRVLDEHPGTMAVGEVWVRNDERLARYVRPDELHQIFNFRLLKTEWDAEAMRESINRALSTLDGVGAAASWVLSNHDTGREVTRYGGGDIGLARARAAALLMLALPGAAYIYNGEELGLADVELPDEALQDPVWEHSGHTRRGRDGCRVSVPWSGTSPPYGFGTTAATWLPMPADWAAMTVEAQRSDAASTLSLYRRLLELRRTHPAMQGELSWYDDQPPGCLLFRRTGGLTCLVNIGSDPVPLPAGDTLISSAPVVDGMLPGNAAAWLAPQ